jgi:8-oxo-dGTP pyrophosphatase MutT (NUDIX family)
MELRIFMMRVGPHDAEVCFVIHGYPLRRLPVKSIMERWHHKGFHCKTTASLYNVRDKCPRWSGEPPVCDEWVDVIDEKDRITGRATKTDVHRQGLRHRVAAVLLQRADGKYLIPTASGIKAEAGLLYHSAAGHVLSGESYPDSARRELQEETGLSAVDLEYLGTFWFKKDYPFRTEKERFYVYRAIYRRRMGAVRLNEEQVKEQWLSRDELEAIYRNKRESISAPLLMSCQQIFGFESERKE